jgi:hypothetical protein
MAFLNQSTVIIKVSELVKDGHEAGYILSDEIINSIEEVIQELVGSEKLVEISKE